MANVTIKYDSLIDAANVFNNQASELDDLANELNRLYSSQDARVKKYLEPPNVSNFISLAEKLRQAGSLTKNIATIYGDFDEKLSTQVLLELVCFIMDVDYSSMGENKQAVMILLLNTIGMSRWDLANSQDYLFNDGWMRDSGYAWCAMFSAGVLETIFGEAKITPNESQSVYKLLFGFGLFKLSVIKFTNETKG